MENKIFRNDKCPLRIAKNNTSSARLERKPTMLGRWRQRLSKKTRMPNNNSYLSLSEMIDCDYPFHTDAAAITDCSKTDQSTASDWSLTKALVHSANLDSVIRQINIGSDRQPIGSNENQESSSRVRDHSQMTDFSSAPISRCSRKIISRKMKSFRANLRPTSIRTVAVF